MIKRPICEIIQKKIEVFENEYTSFIDNPHDFILVNDSKGNPLVIINAYTRTMSFRNTWIKYETNGGNIGFVVF